MTLHKLDISSKYNNIRIYVSFKEHVSVLGESINSTIFFKKTYI